MALMGYLKFNHKCLSYKRRLTLVESGDLFFQNKGDDPKYIFSQGGKI